MLNDTNPSALLQQLNSDELRKHLGRLDQERAAVLVLLRAARAKDRAAIRAACESEVLSGAR